MVLYSYSEALAEKYKLKHIIFFVFFHFTYNNMMLLKLSLEKRK